MGRLDQDITEAGEIPAGQHTALVQKMDYQVKTGDKWNNDGTKTVEKEEWEKFPDDKARVQYTLKVGGASAFHELYFTEKSLGFVKRFLAACGVPPTKGGYNPEDAIGRQVVITITTVEKDGFDPRNQITKFSKA